MAQDRVLEVINRTMKDDEFLDLLMANPEEALKDYELTEEEYRVPTSGDEIELNEIMGLGKTANINSNKYNHSHHQGPPSGQKPDLLPRVVSG
jgi:hypothetical protein